MRAETEKVSETETNESEMQYVQKSKHSVNSEGQACAKRNPMYNMDYAALK